MLLKQNLINNDIVMISSDYENTDNELESNSFPTGDITIISEKIFNLYNELNIYISNMKDYHDSYFGNKGEAIANAILSVRHLEDAETRLLKSKHNILYSNPNK